MPGRVMRSMIPIGGRDAADLLVLRYLAERVGQNRSIHCPAGARVACCREGPMLLLVTSIARVLSVSLSIPRWILRQTRRFAPPC